MRNPLIKGLQALTASLIVLFTTQSFAAKDIKFELGKEWKTSNSFISASDLEWKLKSDDDVMATVMKHDNSKISGQVTEKNMPKVIDEFTKGRTSVLSLAGIDDWKIENHNLVEKEGQKILTLQGGYTNTKGQLIAFEEVHHFIGNQYVVFSLTFPKNSKFAKSDVRAATVQKFQDYK